MPRTHRLLLVERHQTTREGPIEEYVRVQRNESVGEDCAHERDTDIKAIIRASRG